jgi:hypothetical protein
MPGTGTLPSGTELQAKKIVGLHVVCVCVCFNITIQCTYRQWMLLAALLLP